MALDTLPDSLNVGLPLGHLFYPLALSGHNELSSEMFPLHQALTLIIL